MTIHNLFITPVKIISMPNFHEINEKIGKTMSLGFGENFTDNLPKEEGEALQKIFIDEAEKYLEEVSNKKIQLIITTSWTRITKKYGFSTPHIHSDNTVVGVYYIKTSENCGDLLLQDPRGSHMFTVGFDVNTEGYTESDRNHFRITPKAGNLILFPAYVLHSVLPNMSDETRINLAMNFKHKDYKQFKNEK
jgi:uncharacterized protein (TIGR02466 family)